MLKKYSVFFIFIFTVILSACAKEADFINSLKNCTPYTDSGNFTTEGIEVKSVKSIKGYSGDKCVYQENISFMGLDTCIRCKFSKSQIKELSSVMEAYELVQKYSNSSPDLSSLDSAQNNPVSKVWAKYLQDSSVCTIFKED